ncbi:MAG TPA: UDP-N-acetylmuramoyl-tripeptide--D-alanyl-D-alanine ligase [Thermoanaerobaculia bacterium]|nr:UDP-N-acetylmuramoyl-tripeptide--D-alanyl-D-alanine ligase [Thermoanaerobaculia bacterium]
MASLLASEAASAAGGRVIAGDAQARLHGAAIDSRAVRGGELFFAFAGAHADGHRFVGDAFRRGAAGAVVQDPAAAAASWAPYAGEPPAGAAAMAAPVAARAAAAPELRGRALIQVADTLAALHDVARVVRRRVPRRLIGITGSAGKTTTKELLAAMLATRYRVARNPGNFNNLYGFPLALLNVPDDAEWMVAEMGMSTRGELRQLSLLGRPDVALFTVVRPAHLESFDSLRGIAEAKAELLAGLAPGGLVVANAGDPEVVRIALRYLAEGGGEDGGRDHEGGALENPAGIAVPALGQARGRRRVVWYGVRSAAFGGGQAAASEASHALVPPLDVVALDPAPGPGGIGSRFVLLAGGRSQEVWLPLHGLYNVENCLAAAACAFALGVTLADVAAAAEQARPATGRGVVHRVVLHGAGAREEGEQAPDRGGRGERGDLTVIDDSYNSNPDALEKALAGAAQLPAARRLAVLGDMLELGPESPRFHRQGGLAAARLGFDLVAGVGELARELVAGAREGGAAAAWHPDAGAAADWAAAAVQPGDVVLVKGSRGIGLDAVVRRLLALGETGRGGEA